MSSDKELKQQITSRHVGLRRPVQERLRRVLTLPTEHPRPSYHVRTNDTDADEDGWPFVTTTTTTPRLDVAEEEETIAKRRQVQVIVTRLYLLYLQDPVTSHFWSNN